MAIIFGDHKKKAVPVAVSVHEESDGDGILKALAESMINAIKDGDAQALAQVLKSVHMECEDYEEED